MADFLGLTIETVSR
ncbi:hypothetical protein EOA29_34645, partial [Mesorhizobium sp. M1E.F.Ca.ET.063.01.1.1]